MKAEEVKAEVVEVVEGPNPEEEVFEIKREIKMENQASRNRNRSNYEGTRVAKIFDGISFPGVVVTLNDDDEEPWWKVEYNDGDDEDLNEAEVKRGAELYRKEFGGSEGGGATKRRLF